MANAETSWSGSAPSARSWLRREVLPSMAKSGRLGQVSRSPATRDALAPQGGLYALNERGEAERLQVVGSVCRVLVAPEAPDAVLAAMAHPDTRVVSLTVTEKGYCRDPVTGELDEAHPDIRHDLANPGAPCSAPGFLAAAVERRRAAGLPPFAVLCCDNLPANGQAVRRVLARFAALRTPGLGAFVEDEVACPDTMVDRIVPATTDADRARVATRLGLHDAWPVVAESFTQWVIEDRFPQGRPAWEDAGATLTRDVAPWEAMKLRMLNAAHSALAYGGQLAGRETVADCMADPALAALARRVMDEAAEILPPGLDTAAYRDSLLARFRNPALRHRTAQIAMDGTQKLPQRILSTLSARLDRGLPIDTQALVVAAWMRFVAGTDALHDPLAPELRRAAAAAGPAPDRLAPALLALGTVFGPLGSDTRVQAAVENALTQLDTKTPYRRCHG